MQKNFISVFLPMKATIFDTHGSIEIEKSRGCSTFCLKKEIESLFKFITSILIKQYCRALRSVIEIGFLIKICKNFTITKLPISFRLVSNFDNQIVLHFVKL